jgi:hypothetical protein
MAKKPEVTEETIEDHLEAMTEEAKKRLDAIWDLAFQAGVKSTDAAMNELKETNRKLKEKIEAILKALD